MVERCVDCKNHLLNDEGRIVCLINGLTVFRPNEKHCPHYEVA